MICKIIKAKSWLFIHKLSGLHVACTVLNFLYGYVFLLMSMFLTTTAGLGKGKKNYNPTVVVNMQTAMLLVAQLQYVFATQLNKINSTLLIRKGSLFVQMNEWLMFQPGADDLQAVTLMQHIEEHTMQLSEQSLLFTKFCSKSNILNFITFITKLKAILHKVIYVLLCTVTCNALNLDDN